MTINIESIAKTMIDAARKEVADRWPSARALAEGELRKLASTFADVQKMLASGQIDLTRARALIRMQENSARCVLRMVEGVSVLTSRHAVSAAIRAAATVVNSAVGVKLIYVEQTAAKAASLETPDGASRSYPTNKAASGTRRPERAKRVTAASAEPAEESSSNFKAGKDL